MVKTVFFDLGNVLIHVNFPKLLTGLEALSGLKMEEIQAFLEKENLRKIYETGKISTQDLYFALNKRAKKDFSLTEFEVAFSNIFTPKTEVWPIVEHLKKENVQLILLSNTSECHFEYSKKHYPVLQLFDEFVLSYKVGVWKPDPKIFETAMKKARCAPENCFYTDDIPEFIESAKNLGLPGAVFQDAVTLKKDLAARKFL